MARARMVVWEYNTKEVNTMCCAEWTNGEYDHDCPECEAKLDKDGDPVRGCFYSPVICKACGDSPCDGSC